MSASPPRCRLADLGRGAPAADDPAAGRDDANLLLDATITALGLLAQLDGALLAEAGLVRGFETDREALPRSPRRAATLSIAGTPDAHGGELAPSAADLPLRTTGFLVMASESAFVPGGRGRVGDL